MTFSKSDVFATDDVIMTSEFVTMKTKHISIFELNILFPHDCHLDVCEWLSKVHKAFCNTYQRIINKNCATYNDIHQNDNHEEKSYHVNISLCYSQGNEWCCTQRKRKHIFALIWMFYFIRYVSPLNMSYHCTNWSLLHKLVITTQIGYSYTNWLLLHKLLLLHKFVITTQIGHYYTNSLLLHKFVITAH